MDASSLTRENETRVYAAEREGRGIVDAWPVKFYFEFTAACNIHCFMCDCEMARNRYREQGHHNFTIPHEVFRLIVDKAFPYTSIVNPTAVGEPMLLPYFDELLDACHTHSVKLDLITNGTLLQGKRVERMLPVIAALTLSMDGATKKTFEYVRTGADFQVVMDGLAYFSRLRRESGLAGRVRLNFNVTLLRENVEELPGIVEIAAAHGVDCVAACYMIAFGEALRSSSPLLDPARTNRCLAEARKRAKELGVEVLFPAPLPVDAEPDVRVEDLGASFEVDSNVEEVEIDEAPEPVPDPEPVVGPGSDGAPAELSTLVSSVPGDWQGKMYCKFPWREAFVSQGGEVSPCCAQGRPVFGNAFERDFEEIWNGPEYQRLRRGIFEGDPPEYCRECTFLQEAGSVPFLVSSYQR